MPAGSLQQWTFTFTVASASGPATPYPIGGATWEYVARTSPGDLGTPLIDITTTPTSAGVITVTFTSVLAQVLLTIYPAATAGLNGSYSHSLWMDPGTPSALTWCTGSLLVDGNPQP